MNHFKTNSSNFYKIRFYIRWEYIIHRQKNDVYRMGQKSANDFEKATKKISFYKTFREFWKNIEKFELFNNGL